MVACDARHDEAAVWHSTLILTSPKSKGQRSDLHCSKLSCAATAMDRHGVFGSIESEQQSAIVTAQLP